MTYTTDVFQPAPSTTTLAARLPFAVVQQTKSYTVTFWEGTREECEAWRKSPEGRKVIGSKRVKVIPNPSFQ